MGKTIAQESLALGVTQLFAPIVDLARELRFGRVSRRILDGLTYVGEKVVLTPSG